MKHILVMCATSHLGQGLIAHLAEEKHPLILMGRNAEKLSRIKHSLKNVDFDAIKTAIVDFSNESSIHDFERWLQEQKIELQGTVVITPRPKITNNLFPSSREWQDLLQECFIGPLEVIKISLPFYVKNGKILIVSGISSIQVLPEHAAFGSLRALWLAHAKALSHQLGPQSIHINTISPGGILTDYMHNLIEQKAEKNGRDFESQYAESIANVPLRKYATVQEISNIIDFFLSPKSNHITGVNIACDGGFTKNY